MKIWHERHTWKSGNADQKAASLEPANIRRIAVIKHAAYGDLLCTRPFLVMLRESFPAAHITFCGISHYTRGIPEDLVDRVHIVPSRKDRVSVIKTLQAYRQLGDCDLLFDLTGSTPSFLISRLNHAGLKIGFQHRNIHRFVYDVAIPRAEFRFEAETFIEQLNLLGYAARLPLDYAMPVEPAQRDKPYIIYFLTASTPDKCWAAEKYIDLIDQIASQYRNHEHILLKGLSEWEQQRADDVHKGLSKHTNIIVLDAGKNDAELIKGAQLLVGNDTGIRHLAIALNTPTIGIFYHAAPFGYWPRFGKHEVVYRVDGTMPEVDPVRQAIERLLNND